MLRFFNYLFLVLTLILIAGTTTADTATILPPHGGKCGNLDDLNMGDSLNKCKVGEVILVQRKVVPMYCDYRYAIVKHDGEGVASTYTCVLRVLRNK